MSLLSTTLKAAAAGQTVRAALLAEFMFKSVTKRVWPGAGTLTTLDAKVWEGLGALGTVDGLGMSSDTSANSLTFHLSGVDSTVVSEAANAETEVKGYPCRVYVQFFNSDWSPLDNPLAIAAAVMDTMSLDATGPDTRGITLTAETIFASRKQARFARYTNFDQQARFPGDRACEFTPQMVNAVFQWPRF